MTEKPIAPLTGDAAAAEGLRMAFDAEDQAATPPLYSNFSPHVIGYVKKVLGTEYGEDGSITAQVNEAELYRFLHIAHRCQLDPLASQIHLVGRWDKRARRKVWTAQTSIDGYRLIAQRTGEMAGSTDVWFDDGKTAYEWEQWASTEEGVTHPQTASITVRRIVKGQMCEATATARWAEYAPAGNQAFMWNKMPLLMLGKVAEALAWRRLFPAELSGLFTDAEMHQAEDPPNGDSGTTVFEDRPQIEDPVEPVVV